MDHPRITRIDEHDPRVIAAAEAERRLFAHFGLQYRTHYVDLKEPAMRVRVLEVGSGKPLLMVAGGSGDAWMLAALMAHLKGYHLIAVNRPGAGMSDGIDHQDVDLRRFAVHTLSTVLDAFGLQRVPVIAGSMGGLWSFWLALDHPERVATLVQLGCPALLLDTSAPFFMRLISVPGLGRLLVRALQPRRLDTALAGLRNMGTRQTVIDALPPVFGEATYHFFHLPTYLDTWRTLLRTVMTPRGAKPRFRLDADQLRGVQQPVLLIWGDHDPFGKLDVARQAATILPNARLHALDAGHLPFVDDPAECGRAIRSFLPARSGAGRSRLGWLIRR
ncbi:MAG: alpha/beta hydrolase [Chloroflexota bacterium]|nr:alpha/beta hydrolase [Chloroflexota bacterium]